MAIINLDLEYWLKNFVSPSREDQSPPPIQKTHTLIYVLNYSGSTLLLSLLLVKIKKNGAFAKVGQIEIRLNDYWTFSESEKKQLTEADWDTLHLLVKSVKMVSYSGVCLSFPGAAVILKQLIDTGKCYFQNDLDHPVRWGNTCQGRFEWKFLVEKQGQKLEPVIESDKEMIKNMGSPSCYLARKEKTFGIVEFSEEGSVVDHLLKAPFVPLTEVKRVRDVLSRNGSVNAKYIPNELVEKVVKVNPKPLLKVSVDEFPLPRRNWNSYAPETCKAVGFSLYFRYGDHLIASKNNLKESETVLTNGNEVIKIERNSKKEREYDSQLIDHSFIRSSHDLHRSSSFFTYGSLEENITMDLLTMAGIIAENVLPVLKKKGWEIEIDPSFPIKGVYDGDEWFLDAGNDSGPLSDWFDVKLEVVIDGERVNLVPAFTKMHELFDKELEEGIEDKDHLIRFMTSEGKMIKLSAARVRKFMQHLMVEFSHSTGENVRISKWNAGFLNELVDGEMAAKTRWIGSDQLKSFASIMNNQTLFQDVQTPQGLQCELRPYQKEGLNWMQFLSRSQMNGILADDMGLGKTVQALAHILVEKESGRMKQPTLVIAPTSLMPNWYNEAQRLAPSLKVLVSHGNERKQHFSKLNDYDLILTTYPLLMRDKEFLVGQQFHMMILDEAQMVKNFKTQAYQVVQQISSGHRLCLSGTPMENHLGELWALFHLLLPGFLGDQKTFQSIYRKPIEKMGNTARKEALAKRIKPFILRRTKKQVALELPEKTEIIQKIELKSKQRDLYEAIRLRAQRQVMKEIEKKGLAGSQIIVLDALLKLRQVCCDPRLVKLEKEADRIQESAKLECLLEMLEQMISEQRKILIFSQFTSMLALISKELIDRKIAYTILTGEIKDRDTPVKEFQKGTIPVMLISLKAGGVGLNLTAADTVIHYDPWWNPAVEDQATDRAHRIGQKNAIFVYKLVISGSLEEKILELQARKKGLISSMLDENANLGQKLSMADLEDIFKPLPQPI